jgi:hypothetical protein
MADERANGGKTDVSVTSAEAGAGRGDGGYGSGMPVEVFRPSRGEPMAGLIASAVLLVSAVSILGFIVRELAPSRGRAPWRAPAGPGRCSASWRSPDLPCS